MTIATYFRTELNVPGHDGENRLNSFLTNVPFVDVAKRASLNGPFGANSALALTKRF